MLFNLLEANDLDSIAALPAMTDAILSSKFNSVQNDPLNDNAPIITDFSSRFDFHIVWASQSGSNATREYKVSPKHNFNKFDFIGVIKPIQNNKEFFVCMLRDKKIFTNA